ncbi:unnamed protein product, partial [Closterium sp. NIES-54]
LPWRKKKKWRVAKRKSFANEVLQSRAAYSPGADGEKRRVPPMKGGGEVLADGAQATLAAIPADGTLSASAEGVCYRCVPPDPDIDAAALGASESDLPGTAPAEALHTFTLDSGASRCFFRDSTTLTPLPAPVPIRLADPSKGPVVAHSSTVLACLAIPSGSLSGLHLPSFSTNLVSTPALQDAMVTTTTPGGQRVSICTCKRTGLEAAPYSCCLLSHQTLLWHHHLGHPSLPRLRGMHSHLLVSGLPRSLPPLPPLPAPPCLPCVEGRQRAAPHSSSFPPTTAPLHTLHMDRFRADLHDLHLHSDKGGEFTSDLLWDFCRGEGILQLFTLPASPQKNGIAERRIGLVMELARTSMIHAVAPHFLWSFEPASPLPSPSPYSEHSDGLTERCEPASRPISPVRTARRVLRSRPPPVPGTHAMALPPSSVPLRVPLPAPPGSSLPAVPDPESDRTRATTPTVSRLLATTVTDPSFESAAASALVAELLDFAAAYHLDYATALVAESATASPPSVGGECALGTDVLEDRQEDFECLAADVPRFASMPLAPEGDLDAPDIPTPRSYAKR